MNIFITAARGETFKRHFPTHILEQLDKLGDVSVNPYERNLTPQELASYIGRTDVLVTHWGAPQIDETLLACAPRLKLLAHAAGTVARIASEALYARGIPVISANAVMARYVAEGVLGYMLAGLRQLPWHDRQMKDGLWIRDIDSQRSLLGASIGLIGLGAVGRFLLELLRPFGCSVHVFDPYLCQSALESWPFARLCTLEEALRQPVVSIHAAQTPETYHMIGRDQLALLPDSALLINTARGSLVDMQALLPLLQSGRLYAVLDVFEQEGIAQEPTLRQCEHCILQPHMAAACATDQLTQAIVDDIKRFQHNEDLHWKIGLHQFRHMTQE